MQRKLFLIGMLGVGKTSVGRWLADRLELPFVDSDHVLEERTAVDLAWIFDVEGEEGLRRREQKIIDELTQKTEIVLATGGGAVVLPENQHALQTRGLVVYLKTEGADLLSRMHIQGKRPMLDTANPKGTYLKLLAERVPQYESIADITCQVEGQDVSQLGEQILEALEKHGWPHLK